jgi:hypothetical protein
VNATILRRPGIPPPQIPLSAPGRERGRGETGNCMQKAFLLVMENITLLIRALRAGILKV